MDKFMKLDELTKMNFSYRYLSLLLSTIVYGGLVTVYGTIPKTVVLAGMILSCTLVTYLYFLTEQDRKKFRLILILEVIANCFFVIVSGGFSSPYIWYTLSSVLLAASLYEREHTAIVAACYLFSGTIGTMMNPNWKEYMLTNSLIGVGYLLLLYGMLSLTMEYLEKVDMDQIREKLVISEEQNRMANHIHDTVLQKLFALSCSTYMLEKSTQDMETSKELAEMKTALDNTMTELREAIYGIDWSRNHSLQDRIREYLEEIGGLHHVQIQFDGDEAADELTDGQKTALYRIVCEAVNNGIRHGDASLITIEMQSRENRLSLLICDNGCGMRGVNKKEAAGSGNGLRNIQQLAEYLKGSVKIRSNQGSGVTIQVDFAIR